MIMNYYAECTSKSCKPKKQETSISSWASKEIESLFVQEKLNKLRISNSLWTFQRI